MSSQDLIFFMSTILLLMMTLVGNRVMKRRAEARQRSLKVEKYSRDLEVLDRILKANPTYAQAYWHKGRIYEAMGRTDESRRYYRVAKAISPRVVTSGDDAGDTLPIRQAAFAAPGPCSFGAGTELADEDARSEAAGVGTFSSTK
jgi:tetratricopeptide (TPR) repeat protein